MPLSETKQAIARERIGRLFRFMSGMMQLSSPPCLNSKAYAWKYRWRELPVSKSIQLGRLTQSEDDPGDDFILRVRRPETKEDEAYELFELLLELHHQIERESEKVELVLGDGWVQIETESIHHPLLLQKLQLEFLADSSELILRENDRESELYVPLLRRLSLAEAPLQRARKLLQEHAAHPLSKQPADDFFAALWSQLWPEGAPCELRREPLIYLGLRSASFSQAIESFLGALPDLAELPPSLVRVVGVEAGTSSLGPALEDQDLLLTMPSNPEQERVVKRLHSAGSVLVQGPPGTGKTHTIANLIGHLLAEGKSILVTSQASKALRIVRDMVIPELRPLCVSVLDQESESRDQLELAVKGIVHRFTSSDPEELETMAGEYQARRLELRQKLSEAEARLLQARMDEYQPVQVGSESTLPARAAQLLVDPNAARHQWIPGPVKAGLELPLSQDELRSLYRLNKDVPPEVEADLEGNFPPLDELLSESDFRDLVAKKRTVQAAEPFGEEFWEHDDQESRQLKRLLEQVERVVAQIQDGSAWLLDCMRVGMLGGAHKQAWEDLVQAIECSIQEFAEMERVILTTGVAVVESELTTEEALKVNDEILAHFRSKGALTMWTFVSGPWKKLIASVRVHGKSRLQTMEEAEGVRAVLRLRQAQQLLRSRWDRQMSSRGAPNYDALGEQAHEAAFGYLPQMKAALSWYEQEWDSCRRLMKDQGLRWSTLVDRVSIDTGLFGELYRIREACRRYLIPTLQSRRSELDSSVFQQRLTAQERLLSQSKDLGGILGRLRQATIALDVEAYARALNWLMQLNSLREPVAERNLLLNRIREVAPEWAQAIREHRPPHERSEPPGEAIPAWRFRQWTQQLEKRAEVDPEQLQQEVIWLKNQLRLATAQYVEHRTWANQLRRTGVRQQQALIGWLDLMRKIGSGKGKRAPKLKATAREKLAECRDAVPVWIMPLARVAESYHPGETLFDVVILDEASQCDVTGLLAFSLGRQVLVVGDNEQVSPEAVGMSYDKIEALIEEHLFDVPNKELYDGKTSVYDLARQSFGGTIRLVEHFRCVPEIIAFSNKLCYQGEIQPLRESSKGKLKPPTLFHRVSGGSYQRKVNRSEAEETASLLLACAEQPEYAGQTFGVISLVGEEQAVLVDKLLTKHLSLSEYQARRVLCGNAAQFQGDERDVMFLSLVETADDSSALSLRRSETFTKRFNVAASRARNQLWVVGCLDPDLHLKSGDLREVLIRHVLDPDKTMAELAEMGPRDLRNSESLALGQRRMSQILFGELQAAGYRVHRDFPVGNYRLDLVVEGPSQRLAIRCDGDRDQAPDRFKVVVEREAVLERLGWRFLSLRASQFYREPQRITHLMLHRLRELGLEPYRAGSEAERPGDSLLARVLARSAQLLRIWRGEEEPTLVAPLLEAPPLPPLPELSQVPLELPPLPPLPPLPQLSQVPLELPPLPPLPPLPQLGQVPLELPPLPPLPPLPELRQVPLDLPTLPPLPPLPELGQVPLDLPTLPPLPPLPELGQVPLDLPALPPFPPLLELSQVPLELPPLPQLGQVPLELPPLPELGQVPEPLEPDSLPSQDEASKGLMLPQPPRSQGENWLEMLSFDPPAEEST